MERRWHLGNFLKDSMTIKVKAETAGVVQQILLAQGAKAQRGDTVLLLEAMKMEFPVDMPVAGVIAALLVSSGDAVAEGDTLFEYEKA